MNIIIIKDKLKEGLDAVARAASEHPALPILKNILLEAKNDIITLIGTNLEIGLKYQVSGKVSQEGALAVPAGLLNQLVANLGDERVSLSAEGNVLQVSTENYKAIVAGMPASEFPLLPSIESAEQYLEIESAALKAALGSVLAAAQFSELRPELSSVYFQFLGDKIVLVATDSFRLAEKTVGDNQFTSTTPDEFKALLPLRTAQELTRVLKDKGMVRMYHDPNQALFRTEQVEFISRLLEGAFPDYQAVIPKEYQAEALVDRDEFLDAVKLAGVMSGAAGEVTLRPGAGDTLEIFSRDEKLGENAYQLAAKVKGSFREASFNWKYLLEGAKALPPKEMVLGLNDDNKPAVLRSRQDASYFYILMPILKG